jgi:hypothetical protein
MKILKLTTPLFILFSLSAKAQLLLPGANVAQAQNPYAQIANPYGGLTSQLAGVTAMTLYPSLYGNSFQRLYNAQSASLYGQQSYFSTPFGTTANPYYMANYGLGSTGFNPYVYNGGRFHTGISALGYGSTINNDPNFGSALTSFSRGY